MKPDLPVPPDPWGPVLAKLQQLGCGEPTVDSDGAWSVDIRSASIEAVLAELPGEFTRVALAETELLDGNANAIDTELSQELHSCVALRAILSAYVHWQAGEGGHIAIYPSQASFEQALLRERERMADWTDEGDPSRSITDLLAAVDALLAGDSSGQRHVSAGHRGASTRADAADSVESEECRPPVADIAPSSVEALLRSINDEALHVAQHLVDSNRGLLGRFEGIPAPIDVLEIVGRDRSEHVYCNILAWLLSPDETHGMGDSFLRRFLAVAGISHRGRVFSSNEQLAAAVKREVGLPEAIISRPEEVGSGKRKAASRLGPPRIDVVVALDSLILLIEVKVEASSHNLEVQLRERRQLPQAAAYLAAGYRLAHDPTLLDEYEKFKARIGATSVPGLTHRAPNLRVRGVLVHLPGSCPDHARHDEKEFKTAHVTWTALEAILQACVHATQPRHQVDTLLSSFRTSILRLVAQSGGVNIPRLVERFRVLSSHPNLIARSPLQACGQVRELVETISNQEQCMLSQPRYNRSLCDAW